MSDSDSTSIDKSQLQGPSKDFFEYCTDESARRRDSGDEFEESVFQEALDLVRKLENQGILLRYYDSPGLTDHVRISVGREDQSDALLAALDEIGREQPDSANG